MKKLMVVLTGSLPVIFCGCGVDVSLYPTSQTVEIVPSTGFTFNYLASFDPYYLPVSLILWAAAAALLFFYIAARLNQTRVVIGAGLEKLIIIAICVLSLAYQAGMVTVKRQNLFKIVSKEQFDQYKQAGNLDALYTAQND